MLAIKLVVAANEVEQWSEALLSAGAWAVDVADADSGTGHESPNFVEPGYSEALYWPCNTVEALFADQDSAELLSEISKTTGLAVPPFSVEQRAELDWVRASQAQFTPIKISPNLWIVPSWCEPIQPAAINLMIDPGLAFGTGSHPTTRLCLQWLEQQIVGGETVIDYGCGSGILAIAAAKLGAGQVIGVDVDPQALAVSRDNAARNQVQVELSLPAAKPPGQADVLVANILANPLCILAPLFAQTIKTGGAVILSGVLSEQTETVLAAYQRWFTISLWREEENWVAIAGIRR